MVKAIQSSKRVLTHLQEASHPYSIPSLLDLAAMTSHLGTTPPPTHDFSSGGSAKEKTEETKTEETKTKSDDTKEAKTVDDIVEKSDQEVVGFQTGK